MINSTLNQTHSSSQATPSNDSTAQTTPIAVVGYQCRHCQKVLSTKQSLKEHSYTHTGQKPYVCKEPGCGQTFRQSSQLSYHKRIHTELKKVFKGESKVIENINRSSLTLKKKEKVDKITLPPLPEQAGPGKGIGLGPSFECLSFPRSSLNN